jgi:hypothetical protein
LGFIPADCGWSGIHAVVEETDIYLENVTQVITRYINPENVAQVITRYINPESVTL